MNNSGTDISRYEVRRRIFKESVPQWERLLGLEIGPLCNPLLTKQEANVTYYDIASRAELEGRFASSYPGKTFVDVDIVAGERNFDEALGDRKFDFVIANHVIEHIPDFIGYFQSMNQHLNDGGKLFMAIPDRRFTFDRRRPDTSAGHMIVDHEDGGSVDAAEHVLDALIYHEQKLNVYWDDALKNRYDFIHHHHVFCHETFVDRLVRPLTRMRYLPFSLVTCDHEPAMEDEFVVVFEKPADPESVTILGEPVELQPKQDAPVVVDEYDYRVQMAEVARSGWFDPSWYLKQYVSVRMSGTDPLKHYFFWGAYNGFNPSPRFDSRYYLEANPDVRQANLNPLWHYLHNGIHEGRLPLPKTSA